MENRRVGVDSSGVARRTFHVYKIVPGSNLNPRKVLILKRTLEPNVASTERFSEPKIHHAVDPLFSSSELVDVKPALLCFEKQKTVWCCDTCDKELPDYVSLAGHMTGNICNKVLTKPQATVQAQKTVQDLYIQNHAKNGSQTVSGQAMATNEHISVLPIRAYHGVQSFPVKLPAFKVPKLPVKHQADNDIQVLSKKGKAVKNIPISPFNSRSRKLNCVQKLAVKSCPKQNVFFKPHAVNSRQNLSLPSTASMTNLGLPFDTRAATEFSKYILSCNRLKKMYSSKLPASPRREADGDRNLWIWTDPSSAKKVDQTKPVEPSGSENSLYKFCMGTKIGKTGLGDK